MRTNDDIFEEDREEEKEKDSRGKRGRPKQVKKPTTRSSRLHPSVDAWLDHLPDQGSEWSRSDFESWMSVFHSILEFVYHIEEK